MDQLLKSKYRIGQKLSESPFSLTYQGSFLGSGKPVIIKIYKRGTLNSSLIKSMRQRVLSFTLINHHGLAKLLDGDYGWQGFYYVREFIEGRSLQALFDQGEKLGLEKSCAIADQVLDALAAVHARGIIHAALKPANIFIDNQGLIKVTDFVIEGEITAAFPQRIMGIMEDGKYSAPEELAGRPISSAADIFALGLILYEMVSGKPLSSGQGLAGSVRKLREPLILSKEQLSSLPDYLAEIVARSLERDPWLRLSTAAEFRECLESKSLLSKPPSTAGKPATAELVKIFESVVTQYDGEEIDQESEMLQDVGRVRLRWGKEKHRNWILLAVLVAAVALGLLYAFFPGR